MHAARRGRMHTPIGYASIREREVDHTRAYASERVTTVTYHRKEPIAAIVLCGWVGGWVGGWMGGCRREREWETVRERQRGCL
jgi:hypothetical protein